MVNFFRKIDKKIMEIQLYESGMEDLPTSLGHLEFLFLGQNLDKFGKRIVLKWYGELPYQFETVDRTIHYFQDNRRKGKLQIADNLISSKIRDPGSRRSIRLVNTICLNRIF